MHCSGDSLRAWSIVARFLLVLLSAMGILITACAPDADSLEERVDEYYGALVSRDLAVAYGLEHDLIRGAISQEEYVGSGDSAIPPVESFSVFGISVDSDRALVKLELRFVAGGKARTSTFNDAWVCEAGQWYHAPN